MIDDDEASATADNGGAATADRLADAPRYSATGIDLVGARRGVLAAEPGAWADDTWIRAILAAEDRAARRLPAEALLGRGLLRLRLYLGWSQRDVERASGVDQSTLSRLETGNAANVGSARICAVLRAIKAGDVVILPQLGNVEPTALERMLRGDPWKRAVAEADRRVNRRRSA